MLKGRLKEEPGYLETWGTIKGLVEVWERTGGIEVRGACTDIVELYSWLLPTIANAYPEKEIYYDRVMVSDTEHEKELLKLTIRLFLEENSAKMVRVEPVRVADEK